MKRRWSLPRAQLWFERATWVIPALGVVLGWLLHQALQVWDESAYREALGPASLSVTGATAVLAAVGGGMVTFTGFVFSFVVLVLTFGSSAYSPRTVSYFLRSRSTQWILALFLTTIVFSFVSFVEIGSYARDDFVASASVTTALVLLVLCLLGFLALLHSVGRRIRVDAVLSAFGSQCRRQIVLRSSGAATEATPAHFAAALADEHVLVRHEGEVGDVVAIDRRRLRRLATRRSASITLLVQVGDSVSPGLPIAAVNRSASSLVSRLQDCVVIDVERSLRFDFHYSLRLLVDIALRALSPAVNDPTTAVRAIDEIEGVLRAAAPLRLGPARYGTADWQVLVPSIGWSDLVDLALTEIIAFGQDQPQVTRRLVAMLDGLVLDVPPPREVALRWHQVDLVQRVERTFSEHNRAAAVVSDRQGLGGSLRSPLTSSRIRDDEAATGQT